MELQQLKSKIFNYVKTVWFNKVVDPEGDNSHPGTKWNATRGNNIENNLELAHERLNDVVEYLDENEVITKNLRFEFLLLKASVTSGLTSNIFVENFETIDDITLAQGAHDASNQRIYLP